MPRPDITDAIARMTRTVSVGRELRDLESVVGPREAVERIIRGSDGHGFGVLVLTDRRLLFLRRGLTTHRLQDLTLGAIASVTWTVRGGLGDITLVAGAHRFVLQAVTERDGTPFVDAVRTRTGTAGPTGPRRHAAFPTLLQSGSADHYLVCDPARVTERDRVDADGGVHRLISSAERTAAAVGFIVVTAAVLGLLGLLVTSGGTFWPWAVAGGVIGFLALSRVVTLLDRVVTALRRLPPTTAVRVCPTNTQAWEMCEIARGLTATRAWPARRLDERRRVPELLWEAVRRSVQLDAELADVHRAQAHETLQELARGNLERIDAERAVLDSVRSNLRTVLDVAVAVDRRDDEQAERLRSEQEQRELRRRLSGGVSGPEYAHADAAAGLAAESTEIARMLAEADRLLS